MKQVSRIKELQKVFNMTDANFENFKNFFSDKVVLADHDGSICDTNQVKDELLGEFCRSQLGRLDKNGKVVQDATVNAIHRGAHGLPMNMIFVDIFEKYFNDCKPLSTITINDKDICLSKDTKCFYDLIQKNPMIEKQLIEYSKIVYLTKGGKNEDNKQIFNVK